MIKPYVNSSPMCHLTRMTHRFTRKNKIKNIILALEATSMVGKRVATIITRQAVASKAAQGVLRVLDIFEKNPGTIRSLPRAYMARVAENMVEFRAEVEAKITANVSRKFPMGKSLDMASPKPRSLKFPIQGVGLRRICLNGFFCRSNN